MEKAILVVALGALGASAFAGIAVDDKSILMHETSTGMHKWILSEANIERDVIMGLLPNAKTPSLTRSS